MTLVELSVGLLVAVLVSICGVTFVGGQTSLYVAQKKLQAYTTTLPGLREVLSKTAGVATKARVYGDAATARGTSQQASTSGSAVRLEYVGGANTPGGPWQATIEYRSGTGEIMYRNQDGKEWVVAHGVTNCIFSIDSGALKATLTINEYSADVYVAIN